MRYQGTLKTRLYTSLLLIAFMFLQAAQADSPLGKSTVGSNLLGMEEQNATFLPAEQAFQLRTSQEHTRIRLHWKIADGYYLYKHRFAFKVESPPGANIGEPVFNQVGKPKQDPTFGAVTAFYQEVSVDLDLSQISQNPVQLKVRYQGCAEKGLCYLPQTTTLSFQIPLERNTDSLEPQTRNPSTSKNTATPSKPQTNHHDTQSATALARLLENQSRLVSLGLFFLLGIGLCFTPCILPMIPILSSIIIGQDKSSATRGFLLSLSYVLGMAITYAIAGMIVGITGAKIQVILQQPAVLLSFAGLFVILALSMFGFYELQLPSSLQSRLNNLSKKQRGGTLLGAAIMGVLAALIASPCMSAPLMGALLFIGNSGDMWFGGAALLALGLGTGVPLIILGTSGANLLPKAGAWMDSVKAIFGVLLLATGLWLCKHLLPDSLEWVLWGSLLILTGVFFGAFKAATSIPQQLGRGVGLSLLIAGAALIFNALAPQTAFSQQQVSHLNRLPFVRIETLRELENALQQARSQGKPVLLDYYADWCSACIEMEQTSFAHQQVRTALQHFQLLQVDLTNNPQAQRLLDRFQLIAPPSILFFDAQGQELSDQRIYAYRAADDFLQHLQQLPDL